MGASVSEIGSQRLSELRNGLGASEPSAIDPLRLRRELGREKWGVPRPWGNGWALVARDDDASVVVTEGEWDDGVIWRHASIAHTSRMPTYDELTTLHRAAFGPDMWAYQVFAPRSAHVNIHEHALHLWGRADGAPATPNFGIEGTI